MSNDENIEKEKNKNNSKNNKKMDLKNIIKKKIENDSITNINIDKENTRKYLSNSNSKNIVNKFDKKVIDENSKNYNDQINKELSSDISIDDILINSKITENFLKPTLEKFENLMSINNFGKSQNVYSANAFNAKKEIFGEIENQSKLAKGKYKDNEDSNTIKNNGNVNDRKDRNTKIK